MGDWTGCFKVGVTDGGFGPDVEGWGDRWWPPGRKLKVDSFKGRIWRMLFLKAWAMDGV